MDVGLQLPEIKKSEMIKERLAKKALHFSAQEIPRKAVGDPDEDAAFGDSSGFLQGIQRVIEELEGVDEKNKVEFIVFKRKIFRPSCLQIGSVSQPFLGSSDHEGRSIHTEEAVKGRVEQGEMVPFSAAHIQDPLPWLGFEKDGYGLGHQRFHCPTLRRMVPGLIEPGGSAVKDKAHSRPQIRISKFEARNKKPML
jgi:hypothetical protein